MAWYKKGAIMALGALIVSAGYYWISWPTLAATEWPAWVQAVGSIIAIGTGFAVAIYQTKAAAKLARCTQAENAFNQIKTVVEILKFASSVINQALEQMDDPAFVPSYHEGVADPINFRGVEIALLGIPIFELKSAEMIECFFNVQDCYFKLKGMVDGSAEDANLGQGDFVEWKQHLILVERKHNEAIYQIDRIFEFARQDLEEA